jgi:hypothetical protein
MNQVEAVSRMKPLCERKCGARPVDELEPCFQSMDRLATPPMAKPACIKKVNFPADPASLRRSDTLLVPSGCYHPDFMPARDCLDRLPAQKLFG